MKLRPFALLAGLLMASPAVYSALVAGSMAPGAATRRLLLALLVATLVAGAFESLTSGYGRATRPGDGPFAALRARTPPTDPDGRDGRDGRDGPVVGVPVSRRREDLDGAPADRGGGP